MSVLHPLVAKAKFGSLVDEIKAAERADSLWSIATANFPTILLTLRNSAGEESAGILIDATNWNHRALSITLTDVKHRRFAQLHEIPQTQDEHGQSHIYPTTVGKVWFCIQGTNEFHASYARLVPWESVRHIDSVSPGRVIEACIALIDVDALTPLGAEPALAPPEATPLPTPPARPPPVVPRRGFRQPRQR